MTVKDILLDDFELCLDYFHEECEDPDWEECETIIYSVSPDEADEFMESVVDQLYADDLDELAEMVESLDGTREEVMNLLCNEEVAYVLAQHALWSAGVRHGIGTSVLHVNYKGDIEFDYIED